MSHDGAESASEVVAEESVNRAAACLAADPARLEPAA
jgi:hypothetical protein